MYHTLFVFLILGGFGFPIPEELPLLLGGIAIAERSVTIQGVFLTCYLGVLLSDQLMYLIGYLWGKRLVEAGTRAPYLPMVTEDKVAEVREGLRKNRLVYLFVCRHLFFLRSATFIVAGSLHVPYWEFLTADALAALFSVTLFIWLGYMIGARLSPDVITHLVHQANVVLAVVLVLGLVFYALFVRAARKRAAACAVNIDNEDDEDESSVRAQGCR
jgi:membrane protein DedA with SNARE-associated domain